MGAEGKVSNEGRTVRLALVAVLVLAGLLRLWGLEWHLPFVRQPDESRMLFMTLSLGTGRLLPPELIYGSVMPYLLAIVFGLYFAVLRLTGQVHSLSGFAARFCLNDKPFYMLGRILSVVASLLAVYLVYKAVRRLLPDRPSVALLAALALAVYPMAVLRAHYALPDGLLLLFSSVVVLLLVMLAQRPSSLRLHLLAGLMIGLAAATKVLALPFVVAYVLVCLWERRQGRSFPLWMVGLGLAATAAGVVIGEPSVVFDRATVVRDLVEFQRSTLVTGQGAAPPSHLSVAASVLRSVAERSSGGLGVLAGLLVLLGLIRLLVSRPLRRATLPLVVWLLFLLLWLALQGRYQHNWVTPGLPVLALLCGAGAAWLLEAAGGGLQRAQRSVLVLVAAMGLCVAAFALPALTAARGDYQHILPDTRVLATRLLARLAPTGSTILLDGQTWTLPTVRESRAQLHEWMAKLPRKGRWASLRKYTEAKERALKLWHGPTYQVVLLRHLWWAPNEKIGRKMMDVAPAPPIYEYTAESIGTYRRRGVSFIVSTSDAISRFDNPRFPTSQRFYRGLEALGPPLASIKHGPGVLGPDIYIWRLSPSGSPSGQHTTVTKG